MIRLTIVVVVFILTIVWISSDILQEYCEICGFEEICLKSVVKDWVKDRDYSGSDSSFWNCNVAVTKLSKFSKLMSKLFIYLI